MPLSRPSSGRVQSAGSGNTRSTHGATGKVRPWSALSNEKPRDNLKGKGRRNSVENSRSKIANVLDINDTSKSGKRRVSTPTSSSILGTPNISHHSVLKRKSTLSGRKIESSDATGVLVTELADGSEPWSVTEVPESPFSSEEADDISVEDSFVRSDALTKAHVQGVGKSTALQAWLDGPTPDSDEYDTDLEDDFPPEPDKPSDPTGKFYYEERCKKEGLVPVSYLMRHMGDRNIRMRYHYLGGHASKPLAAAFKRNTIVEMMDLSDNYLEGDGAASLADMLKENMFITNLNISNNFIQSKGAEAVAEMLDSNTTLKTLTLKGNQLNDSDARIIAEALKNNVTLSSLDLSNNNFGELGGIYLAAGLTANEGLCDLDLSWNSIRQKGAVSLINSLKVNTSLEVLDLSWNGLSMMGALALQKILKINNTLKVLDISNNRIDTEALRKLAQGIAKNTGLETLLLNFNPIKEQGMEALLKALSANTSIKLLGLEDIAISPAVYAKIRELEESKNIVILYTRTGGVHPARAHSSVIRLFDCFITSNKTRLEDLFHQLDKDKSGDITLEELKHGLKESGFRLTNRQLDILLDEIDLDKNGTIEYEELLNGELLMKRERRKMFLAARDFELFANARRANLPVVAKKTTENSVSVIS